jgi:two-component system phosphate regulon sensor histidine kinase PhoR
MNLSQRLLAGSLALVAVLVAAIVLIAGGRLHDRLAADTQADLERNARLIGIAWQQHPVNPDSLADETGTALQRRVTLIDTAGIVLGDSEFDGERLRGLENHATRPEVVQARSAGVGADVRVSSSAGDEEMYVATRHPRGFVRVSLPTNRFEAIVSGARRDVLVAAAIAMLGAILLAVLFSRRVSRPIVELRDVATAISEGDLRRRAPLDAPGEVGDLAVAIHRMADDLDNRLTAIAADDALLLAIIEALEEGIIALDSAGNVVRMNDAARSIFESRRSLPFSVIDLALPRQLRDTVLSASRGVRSESVETTVGDRILTVTSTPLPAGGAVLAVLDQTERRRLETVRRDFVANVSHELKTPLTVVAGFAETLRDPELSPTDRARFIDLVMGNTHRMQRIVDDLLDLSRYESSAWTPRRVELDIQATIDDVIGAMQASARDRGVTLGSDVHAYARTVFVDPTALRQILTNLVENALRYTPSGSVMVRAIRLGDGAVRIDVTDTGVGISAEHLSRIFERFYRVDEGRSRSAGGTGLGLAIVRHLVEAHGGQVRAESTPGVGTSVYVTFPAA